MIRLGRASAHVLPVLEFRSYLFLGAARIDAPDDGLICAFVNSLEQFLPWLKKNIFVSF